MRYFIILSLFLSLFSFSKAKAHEEQVYCQEEATTLAIAHCLQAEFEALEKQRLALEEENLENAQETEQKFQDMNSVQYQGYGEKTKQSRELFEFYRETECTRKSLSYGAGSMRAIGTPACMITLTEQRIEALGNE